MGLKNSFFCFMPSANLASLTIVLRFMESTLLRRGCDCIGMAGEIV